jgi:hypothetical protein
MTPEQAYQRGVDCGKQGYTSRRFSFAFFPPETAEHKAYLLGWKHGLSLRDPTRDPKPGDVLLTAKGERAEVKSLWDSAVNLVGGPMSTTTFLFETKGAEVLALGIPRST